MTPGRRRSPAALGPRGRFACAATVDGRRSTWTFRVRGHGRRCTVDGARSTARGDRAGDTRAARARSWTALHSSGNRRSSTTSAISRPRTSAGQWASVTVRISRATRAGSRTSSAHSALGTSAAASRSSRSRRLGTPPCESFASLASSWTCQKPSSLSRQNGSSGRARLRGGPKVASASPRAPSGAGPAPRRDRDRAEPRGAAVSPRRTF